MPFKNKNEQKSAQRRHYDANKAEYKARDKARLERNRQYVRSYKQRDDVKCTQCGEGRWQCLQFHHRDASKKDDKISHLVNNRSSIQRIQTEIDKCDVVCANCHLVIHDGNVWDDDRAKHKRK